jgi:hypothetical protein
VTGKVGFRLDGPKRRGQMEKTAHLGKKSPEFIHRIKDIERRIENKDRNRDGTKSETQTEERGRKKASNNIFKTWFWFKTI